MCGSWNEGPGIIFKQKTPAKETGIFGNMEMSFQVRPREQRYGKAGGRCKRLYPNTTTVNPYFGDPEPKPAARNQGSEPPLCYKTCFLSQPELLCFPLPTPIVFLTSLSVPSGTSPPHNTHSQEAPSKLKYLWSNISGEKLSIMSLVLEIRIIFALYKGHTALSLQSPWLFWKVPFPIFPLLVALQGAAILFNMLGALLAAADWSKNKQPT